MAARGSVTTSVRRYDFSTLAWILVSLQRLPLTYGRPRVPIRDIPRTMRRKLRPTGSHSVFRFPNISHESSGGDHLRGSSPRNAGESGRVPSQWPAGGPGGDPAAPTGGLHLYIFFFTVVGRACFGRRGGLPPRRPCTSRGESVVCHTFWYLTAVAPRPRRWRRKTRGTLCIPSTPQCGSLTRRRRLCPRRIGSGQPRVPSAPLLRGLPGGTWRDRRRGRTWRGCRGRARWGMPRALCPVFPTTIAPSGSMWSSCGKGNHFVSFLRDGVGLHDILVPLFRGPSADPTLQHQPISGRGVR